MQTFLPYPDFEKTAKCLDYRRLGKQRVEAKQILDCLAGRSMGWKNHPAVKMWFGCEDALRAYCNEMILEWIRRGYKNTMQLYETSSREIVFPEVFGDETFHASHRSNLLRKDSIYYSQFGWNEPHNLSYVWNK